MTISPHIAHRWHNAEYAAQRLNEIKDHHYPNGDTHQMIADFDWLIDEVDLLRQRERDRPHLGAAVTVEWTGFPDVECPDCGADAKAICHWWCPRYAEDPDE